MISRRNIRVKVMQTLYTVESLENRITRTEAEKTLNKHIDQSRQLFTYLVYFLTETARYSEKYARIKASKHLPTAEDLNINTKIAGNELLWKILENQSYNKALKDYSFQYADEEEWIRKSYLQLIETPEYKTYISNPAREKKAEKDILEFIFTNLMLPDEDFINHLEETYIHWDDDAEMMDQLMLNFLQKPGSYDFSEFVSAEKMHFAKTLLNTVQDKNDHCFDLIKPKLQNWDPERTANLDMILIKMGICELLYFETIPPKVTLNEYIDLAKEYSTPQSGQFVNGILDSIHKDLARENKLHKTEYKKT